jgi:hypothetical protein
MNPTTYTMELARFGNWSVTTYKIEWKGNNGIEYAVSIPNIVNTGTHKNCIFYQWLIEIAADTRFSEEDIYSLNTAFFYALDNFRTEIEIRSCPAGRDSERTAGKAKLQKAKVYYAKPKICI